LLLLGSLIRLMMADRAAGSGSKHAVVASKVTCRTPDCSSLQTTLRIRRGNSKKQTNCCCRYDESLHVRLRLRFKANSEDALPFRLAA
jgi:hypothetical protein